MKSLMICALALVLLTEMAFADVTSVEPFEEHAFENFTSLIGTPVHVGSVSVFNDTVTVTNLTDGGSIFVSSGSSLGGDQVNAYSSPLAIAQLGISQWDFSEPIVRFAAYFENNSAVDDAVIEFFDSEDNLMGTEVVTVSASGQQWVWNGWESGTPIHKIVVTGNNNNFLNGFIWFDDVEISFPSKGGDVNRDGSINLEDVAPFVDALVGGCYQIEADLNQDSSVDLLDVQMFVEAMGF